MMLREGLGECVVIRAHSKLEFQVLFRTLANLFQAERGTRVRRLGTRGCVRVRQATLEFSLVQTCCSSCF